MAGPCAPFQFTFFTRRQQYPFQGTGIFQGTFAGQAHDTLLYFFSGPDFLFATSFFPTASTYVLAGLEPVGSIPQLTSMSMPTIEGSLRNLEKLARLTARLQLLHHQKHESPIVRWAGLRDAACPLCVSGTHRQDPSRCGLRWSRRKGETSRFLTNRLTLASRTKKRFAVLPEE